jgi:hypothetical protein
MENPLMNQERNGETREDLRQEKEEPDGKDETREAGGANESEAAEQEELERAM